MPFEFGNEIVSIGASIIGGLIYGVKIRLPHAFVMTLLFRRDLSSKQKMGAILKLVREHASNLALFAGLYKLILATLKRCTFLEYRHNKWEKNDFITLARRVVSQIVHGPFQGHRLQARPPGHAEKSHHALVAGAIGGYLVWGKYSGVNYQIVLYLLSRVIMGTLQRIHLRQGWTIDTPQAYRLLAATVWGAVMFLYEDSPDTLAKSLKKSMDEIYRNDMWETRLQRQISKISKNGR